MKIIETVGLYIVFLRKVFTRPQKWGIFFQEMVKEINKLGIKSIGIVAIISAFMGAVITIQTAYNTENPFFPAYLVGLAARDSILLEFSSTIVALILAGKVGSNVASEIGTMRVTEQIDALEIMGINSANHLVLPKIVASVIFNPLLCILSMIVGIVGGWFVGSLTGAVTSQDFIDGIQAFFIPFYITYSLVKTVVFAFLLTSIPAFYGYNVEGGSLEVGQSSTKAVVFSSVMILLFNLILTQLLLS